jgi:hypothetical protein
MNNKSAVIVGFCIAIVMVGAVAVEAIESKIEKWLKGN